MNQFDLDEEIAISNMIRVLESERFNNIFKSEERVQIMEIIRKHIFDDLTKLKSSTMMPKLEQTPSQSEADKLWSSNSVVNSNFPNEEEINSLWGASQHR